MGGNNQDLVANEGYLSLSGVSGNATDPRHAGWIELESVTVHDLPAASRREPNSLHDERPHSAGECTVTMVLDDAAPQMEAGRFWSTIMIDTPGDPPRRITLGDVTIIETQSQMVVHDGVRLWGRRIKFAYDLRKDASTGTHPVKRRRAKPKGGPAHVFLQVPGIPGDAKAPSHTGWIELREFDEIGSDRGTAAEDWSGNSRYPEFHATRELSGGAVTVRKERDSASPKLVAALKSGTKFDHIMIDTVAGSVTQSVRLEDVVITVIRSVKDSTDERVTFSYVIAKTPAPSRSGKPPAAHPVVRAHAAAVNEHSTINLRPPRFFELALPVLSGEGGRRIYPPADGRVRLTSRKGYDRAYPISAGMVTDDKFCSFRFYDISETNQDELFTATLESGGKKETIFQDRRIATYISAARKTGQYEPAPPPGTTSTVTPREELLLPQVGDDEPDALPAIAGGTSNG